MPLTYFEAKHLAEDFDLFRRDFHTLRFSEQELLGRMVEECGYRKPKNANGSTARYFAAYVVKYERQFGTPETTSCFTAKDILLAAAELAEYYDNHVKESGNE